MQSVDAENPVASLADYRQYYGLTSDPFREDPDFPFFGGGGRRALLEQLQHLFQSSASLLAVLGKPGVGKTRLAHELARSVEPGDDVCLLNAEADGGAAELLARMARCFDLPTEGTSVGQLLASLRQFAQVADEQDRLALTIIDDAQHLDEQTLGALISLLQGQDADGRRMHIVLFADLEMMTRLDQFTMHDALIHDIELAPFSPDEAADYLNFRMEMSDYMGPEVFTEDRVAPWCRRADGHLSSLHQSAQEWLLESSSPPPVNHRRKSIPRAHLVVVAALLGALLVAFVFSGDPADEPEGEGAVTRLPEQRESQTLDLSRRLRSEAVPAGRPEAADSRASRPEVEPEPLLAAGREPEPAPSRDPQRDVVPEPEPEPQTLPEVPEDEQVLLSWRTSEYTLQLLGSSSRASVRGYMDSQPNSTELLSYETRRQGEPWFVVVTGRYASPEAARRAIQELPAPQRESGPWPRPLSEVQEEIETVRGM